MRLTRRKLATHTATRLLAGDAVAEVMRELAAYLIETRRTHEAKLVIRDVEMRLLAHGTALATVTSARPLTSAAQADVIAMIEAQTSAKRVLLREVIDEAVIGGVKVEVPGYAADNTVKATLDKLVV